MQGPIAQSVALVAHANGALRGLAHPAFFPGHSTSEFCERIAFVDATGAEEVPVAPNPNEWFARLARDGVRCVRLSYCESEAGLGRDFQTVGIGGGGRWWMLAETTRGRTEGWLSRWELGNRDAPDRRIWRVTYGRLAGAPLPTDGPSVADAARGLERSLEAIAAFSRAHANGAFVDAFEKALSTLRTGEPRGYHLDLGPAGALPPESVRLLDACQAAWVFGGMGWWNDQSFEGTVAREFDRVTEEHWSALTRAIVAAVNASAA